VEPREHYLHAFDLDYTLLKINCSYSFASFLTRVRFFSRIQFCYVLYATLCYKLGLWSLKKLHQNVFRTLFYSKKASLFEEKAIQFIEKSGDAIFNPSLISLLKDIQKRGDGVILLSSSPAFLVGKVAAKLGIQEFLATQYEVDSAGNFQTLSEIIDGEKKSESLEILLQKKIIHKEKLIAYSDSFEDLPFLEKAGHAVVVNPSRKLRRYAIQKNWKILV